MNYKLFLPVLVCLAACRDNSPDTIAPATDTTQQLAEQHCRATEYRDSIMPLTGIPPAITQALKALGKKENVTFPDDTIVFRKIDHSRLLGSQGDYLQVIRSGYRFRFWYKSELIAIEYWQLDSARVHQFETTPDYNDRFYVAGYFSDAANSTSFHSCTPGTALVIRYSAPREFKKDIDVIRKFLLDCNCY